MIHYKTVNGVRSRIGEGEWEALPAAWHDNPDSACASVSKVRNLLTDPNELDQFPMYETRIAADTRATTRRVPMPQVSTPSPYASFAASKVSSEELKVKRKEELRARRVTNQAGRSLGTEKVADEAVVGQEVKEVKEVSEVKEVKPVEKSASGGAEEAVAAEHKKGTLDYELEESSPDLND